MWRGTDAGRTREGRKDGRSETNIPPPTTSLCWGIMIYSTHVFMIKWVAIQCHKLISVRSANILYEDSECIMVIWVYNYLFWCMFLGIFVELSVISGVLWWCSNEFVFLCLLSYWVIFFIVGKSGFISTYSKTFKVMRYSAMKIMLVNKNIWYLTY